MLKRKVINIDENSHHHRLLRKKYLLNHFSKNVLTSSSQYMFGQSIQLIVAYIYKD